MATLDDESIERYARQIIIPGIGAEGQGKLLAATVVLLGHPRGVEQASLYLRAAGVSVSSRSDGPGIESLRGRGRKATQTSTSIACYIVAGVEHSDLNQIEHARKTSVPIVWYTFEPDGGGCGFVCGVHPQAPLPDLFSDCRNYGALPSHRRTQDHGPSGLDFPARYSDRSRQAGGYDKHLRQWRHAVAACDAAAVACALILGLAVRQDAIYIGCSGARESS